MRFAEHLEHAIAIRVHEDLLVGNDRGDPAAALLGEQLVIGGGLPQDRCAVDRRLRQRDGTVLDRARLEEIVDEPLGSRGCALDRAEVARRRSLDLVAQRFGREADRVERTAEVVRDDGEDLVAGARGGIRAVERIA